jgi:galactokinase
VGQFSYLPARLERRVSWPSEYQLAIGVSGVEATKTGNARARYNRASDATRALVRAWNASTGRADLTLGAALATGGDAAERLARLAEAGAEEFPASYLVPRLAQFREEIEAIVPGVGDAIRDRDYGALGRLVDRSQELAERALENQVPETIHLQRSARDIGAVAASAFGAGFGGSVWAMIRNDGADAFVQAWRASYETAFAARAPNARFLRTRPDDAAREITSIDTPRPPA